MVGQDLTTEHNRINSKNILKLKKGITRIQFLRAGVQMASKHRRKITTLTNNYYRDGIKTKLRIWLSAVRMRISAGFGLCSRKNPRMWKLSGALDEIPVRERALLRTVITQSIVSLIFQAKNHRQMPEKKNFSTISIICPVVSRLWLGCISRAGPF